VLTRSNGPKDDLGFDLLLNNGQTMTVDGNPPRS
jgi:hypothetical protein